MDAIGGAVAPTQDLQQQQHAAPALPPPVKVERLNPALQQQLNLESVKTRAFGLFKAISRILEEFDAISRANVLPKWQDVLGQFSMVNLELYNIVEDIKKVSKAFVVYPKNVNAESATILPVMLSSKLLPEMEVEDNSKREQLLHGMQNLPIPMQIEKIKARIDMIGAACETAEKVISDARKSYGLNTRQGLTLIPTLDKAQAAKIQEQEHLLRVAVNFGQGLPTPGDQRHHLLSLPMHLATVFPTSDGSHGYGDTSAVYQKNTPPAFTPNSVTSQNAIMQASGTQSVGRSVPSPGVTAFDNASTPPLPHANSPRSGSNIMNTPSPQQQTQQQQQRQKILQLPQHQQQLLAQQQLRQSSVASVLGQNTMTQLHDPQGQTQQKFQQAPGQPQMQYSQSLAQFQNRQLQSGHIQHAQNQLSHGNQLRSHLGQFTGSSNNTLFNAGQTSQGSQMMSNMPASIQSQTLVPRTQYGLSGGLQRNLTSQMLSDQMFNMGNANPTSMMGMQQHSTQSGFGNMTGNPPNLQSGMNHQSMQSGMNTQNLQQSMQPGMSTQGLQPGMNTQGLQSGMNSQGLQPGMNTQNLQPGMVALQNSVQNPNYPQQRQQGQQ